MVGGILTGSPESLQIALLEGLTMFYGRAMVIMVVHLVVANCCEGGTRLVEITRLQQPFLQHVASDAASKAISFQLPLFPLGMSIHVTEVGAAKFVGEY
ncbi:MULTISPECIES: hypothetical protein [unclassified Synechococcus]|uniref:hypothetical protein n=1 Tax=unclassified Synechococcus TaxID=2626047 RepID=UPI0020CC686A|nr:MULTISPECIES: hypothetical protein [unclassified Synechococcus]